MSLSPQKQIQNGAIGIQPPSSPSAIVFKDYLYIFYIGAGGDGIWYTWSYYSLLRGRQFTAPIQVSARAGTPIPIAPATRPVPVVFNNTLYLFFTALGEKGFSLSLTTSKDGSRWTPAVDVSGAIPGALPVMPATNPAATVHKGHLYLFWCTPSTAPPDRNVNRLQFSELENGKWVGANDVPAVNLGVRPYTSPAVVDFRGQLLVFYDGSGGDGTWVTSYNGGVWAPVISMARFLGGVLYGASTSPAAFLTEDAAELTVLSGPGPPNNGLWFSSTRDGKNWEDVTDIRKEVSLIGLLPGSSSSGVYYHTRPYVFWTGIGEAGLWYSRGAKRTKSVGVVREIDDAEVDCGGEDMMKQGLMGVEGGEMMSEMRWMQGGQLSRRDWLKTVGKVFLAVIALVMVSVFWNVVL